ncbi:phosphate ABC transporter ATP-binding protein PstB [uncultured Pseudonocardia sp.]|jgi:phosphate transport system ATP-binding protein|uniref:phosphate ABC transporter ATP-binding protein PstB n=1 Tax=uncultured Pseudonocardia sp. TaxID=211455 RepID=UPI00262C7AA9|nr:phosphate ABC transporter ATP-binding protein PstB [uncultured Pseudonocardia sp.]
MTENTTTAALAAAAEQRTQARASTDKSGAATAAQRIEINDLTAFYSGRPAVAGVNLHIAAREVTALIGPSGCGKSTLLRCLNGMHLTIPKATVTGEALLGKTNIFREGIDLVELRRRVGMVFQRPNPFPTMSIYDNVVAGLRLGARERRNTATFDEVVERSLTQAQLWNEVKDRLKSPGASLSGGQQQRLCIARAVAVEPEVLLMDEPCSALDPISTLAIEDLMSELAKTYTIAIVTHNMQQAARVSDVTAFLTVPESGGPGRLIEAGPTHEIFSNPTEKATEDYISGRVG